MSFIAVAIGGGALIGAIGSNLAAGTQANAANAATAAQQTDQQASLAEQKREFDLNQANQAPFLKAGQGAVTQLSDLMNNGGFPSWDKTFSAPTADQARQTPGYQFALQQGEGAIENSAAARGGLLSGNTLNAEQQYGQGLADTNYQQVYNNALQQYQQGYNQFQQNQSNQFNRLSTLAGGGQVAANQLGAQGQAASQNIANINSSAGQQIGQSLQNAGAATASGYVGTANAFGGGLSNISQLMMLKNQGLLGGGSSGGSGVPYNPDTGMYDPGYITT